MITVALVDDHALVRAGMRQILTAHPDLSVVAEGQNGDCALRIAREHKPDVLILDLNMPPGISGLEVTRRLRDNGSRTRVLIVSVYIDPPFPRRLLDAGAKGFLSKGCDGDELVLAVRKIGQGGRHIANDIAEHLAFTPFNQIETPFKVLSARELEVAEGIARGDRLHLIAKRLCISVKTASGYKGRMMEKLGLSSDVELSRLAQRYGLFSDDFALNAPAPDAEPAA